MKFDERPQPDPYFSLEIFPDPRRSCRWIRHEVVDPETGEIFATAWVWAYGPVGLVAGAEGLARRLHGQIPQALFDAIEEDLSERALKALRQEWQEARVLIKGSSASRPLGKED